MKIRVILALAALGFGVAMAGACGDDTGPGDGGGDGTITDGGNPDVCLSNCGDGGTCSNLGASCQAGSECCSGNCLAGSCQPPTCTADNAACSSDGECCSGTCTNGTCTPIQTPCTGKTLGNPCAQNSDCCSQYCVNGICGQPSYCGQNGDICQHPSDCCGGICTIQSGKIFGICGQPLGTGAQCTAIDGVICSSTTNSDAGFLDSGLPACGGPCCSRDCAPWGPTQVLICQPASGCKPVGDICTKDSDCCGGQGTNPTEVCNKASPTDAVGVCSNPTGCKPNGDICRLQTNQCNATDNCCSGNVQQYDTCKQDNLGVPRCSYAGDAGCIPVGADAGCASSADCCNLNPCVPDGNGGFTCYPETCVPVSGVCTTDADCCPGGHCYIQGGQTSGTCQPLADGGTCDGGLYGQTCTTSADCCNGVPCTNGRCEIPVN
jgi:hypothetical protein